MQLYRKMCPLYWEAVNCSPIKLFFSNRDISLWRPCHYILLLFPQHWIYNAKKMGNIYSSKWPLCYKMNKEIINGSVSARLHVPLGKINRISPERVKRKKKKEKGKNHPQVLCWGWILNNKGMHLKVEILFGITILPPKRLWGLQIYLMRQTFSNSLLSFDSWQCSFRSPANCAAEISLQP